MTDNPKYKMTSLETLMDKWKADAPIDRTTLIDTTGNIPNLVSDYINIRTYHQRTFDKLNVLYKKERLWYWRYYNHKAMTPEEIEKHSPEITLDENILKPNINAYLDAEEGLTKILLSIKFHEQIIEFCNTILKELSNRSYQMGHMITMIKHEAGK